MHNKKLIISVILFLGIAGGVFLYYLYPTEQKTDSVVETGTGEIDSKSGAAGKDVYFVENPSDSAQLFVKIIHPSDWTTGKLPTVFLVPGSTGSSSEFLKPGKKSAQILADAGFTVVVFDPDGRGKSEGVEDNDGFIQQDGLKAIIEYVSSLPEVDPEQMGIASFSFGVTMASGVLSRYPDLPIKYLSDYEGPANREDTGGCDGSGLGHLDEVADCNDEDFWSEREASTFIEKIKVPYWRIQTKKDHAQPDYKHTVVMINAALAGGVPEIYLNEDSVSSTLDENKLPQMAPDSVDMNLMKVVGDHIKKLL